MYIMYRELEKAAGKKRAGQGGDNNLLIQRFKGLGRNESRTVMEDNNGSKTRKMLKMSLNNPVEADEVLQY